MGENADVELRPFFRAESGVPPQHVSICVGVFQSGIATQYSEQALSFSGFLAKHRLSCLGTVGQEVLDLLSVVLTQQGT